MIIFIYCILVPILFTLFTNLIPVLVMLLQTRIKPNMEILKASQVYATIGVVAVSLICALLACGEDGWHSDNANGEQVFIASLWNRCIYGTCYDLSGEIGSRLTAARYLYVMDYVSALVACLSLIIYLYKGSVFGIIAVASVTLHVLLLLAANVCQMLTYVAIKDKHGYENGSFGWSCVVPWLGMLPGAAGCVITWLIVL